LEDILTGNPVILTDEQGEQLYDEAGKPMVSERTRGRELTEEEQTEYDALKAKLIPTTSVPTTPEEQAAAVEAETDRLLKLGYDDADARAQAEANVSFQVAEDEEIRKEETDRVQKRKQFGTIYDAYIAEGYSEEEATRLAVEDLYYETDTETAGRVQN
jgi:hypothetical protein